MQLEDELEDRSKIEVTTNMNLKTKANTQHNSHTPNYTQQMFHKNLRFFTVSLKPTNKLGEKYLLLLATPLYQYL